MSFRSESATPTDEQFAKIGRIIVDWAVLDNVTQNILSRLAMAPIWPCGALTDNLNYDGRIQALKHLTEIHSTQFGHLAISADLCAEVDDFRIEIAQHRAFRNRLAHWGVHRSNDDRIFVTRHATRLPTKNREDSISVSLDEMDTHIEAVSGLIERGHDLIRSLPVRQLPWHDK